MNLRDLQYLIAVSEHLHYGKAAEICHVSQPTLSMQLKKLEEYLGVQIFERTNKSVMLTAVGALIVSHAREVLRGAAEIREVAKLSKDPFAGELRLGIFPTLAPYLLPSLMPMMKAAFPKLNVLLIEEKTPELIGQLERGTIDVALLAMPVAEEGLIAQTLFTEPFMLAVPASHKLAKRVSVTPSDLHNETMLLLEDGHCLREQALEVCQRVGIGESNNFRATSLETLRHMVASGGAITLIPKLAVREEDVAVKYIPFKSPAPARTIGLYSRKTSAREKLFNELASITKRHYAKI